MKTRRALLAASGCAAMIVLAGVQATASVQHGESNPQRDFFDSMAARCGDEYPGRAIIAPASDDTFRPAFLGMRIDSCTADQIRIAFLVDDDESRTWVLTMEGGELQLRVGRAVCRGNRNGYIPALPRPPVGARPDCGGEPQPLAHAPGRRPRTVRLLPGPRYPAGIPPRLPPRPGPGTLRRTGRRARVQRVHRVEPGWLRPS
jgi:hypothetical protein